MTKGASALFTLECAVHFNLILPPAIPLRTDAVFDHIMQQAKSDSRVLSIGGASVLSVPQDEMEKVLVAEFGDDCREELFQLHQQQDIGITEQESVILVWIAIKFEVKHVTK